jgi:hypothetical protein
MQVEKQLLASRPRFHLVKTGIIISEGFDLGKQKRSAKVTKDKHRKLSETQKCSKPWGKLVRIMNGSDNSDLLESGFSSKQSQVTN